MPLREGRDSIDRDILDIIPERFDSDPDSRRAKRGAHTRVILTIALALLALAALGVAARHLLFGNAPPAQQAGGVPTISADDKPVKSKPANPGGLEVPDKDKLVYERVGSGDNNGGQREHLLPPPEQPQAPPATPRAATIKPAFPAPPAKAPAVKPGEAIQDATSAAPPPPAAAPLPPVATAPAPAAKAAPPTHVASAAAPTSVPTAAAPASHATGDWVAQLAAVKSEAEAKAEWSRQVGANKDVLAGLSSSIVQVDLGAKGVFWRVRAGPLDEAKARSICATLAKRNQGCIVAKK